MKEATGELNMSLIVVTLVAILSTFFFSVIWPRIRTNFKHNSRCDEAICTCPAGYLSSDGKCTYDGQMVECKFKNSDATIMCPWKG